jgi:hypothetical protein
MGPVLYSHSLQVFQGEISNDKLLATIKDLASLSIDNNADVFFWDEQNIAVRINISVDLPPLGNVEGVDLRSSEPILVVFAINDYPYAAPHVYPDRLDFPKHLLPHLYVSRGGKPPRFCLLRGYSNEWDEWYADKRISDIVVRVQNWLRDAASGELATDGRQFEPLRLEGYEGTITYDYTILQKVVEEKDAFSAGGNFSRFRLQNLSKGSSGPDFEFDKIISRETIQELSVEAANEASKAPGDKSKRTLFQGFCVWSDNDKPFDHYDANLPENWGGLVSFCNKHSIDAKLLEEEISSRHMSVYKGVVIVVAIKRPQNIIGYPGNLEFVNFTLILPETFSGSDIPSEAVVSFQRHIDPLTSEKARIISGTSKHIDGVFLVAGCGALGSRFVLHLTKSGSSLFFLFDNDLLSPHNFIRHPLSSRYKGYNKAVALATEVNSLFFKQATAIPVAAAAGSKQLSLLSWSWILDFTASNGFTNALVNTSFDEKAGVLRGVISDSGNLGLLFAEGPARNPRIDDIEVLVYDSSFENEVIHDWLKRESESPEKTESILTGIGCSSETTVLAEDIVASHAAAFSRLFRGIFDSVAQTKGVAYLHQIKTEPCFNTTVLPFFFEPLDVLPALNNNEWQIRFAFGLLEELKSLMREASPKETGGVLLGRANYKTKTIHVTRALAPPPDSHANEACFFRGKEGLSDSIDTVTQKTGGQLGYIGEWHSHPKGPEGMSETDASTVRRFKNEFENLNPPLPVFLLIVTSKNVLPYIF